jgi:DNA-binding IscR family transcriptional regulator
MSTDRRLSRMLHVLLHMARTDNPLTSKQIGTMLRTNPVVVRRTMSGLREAGYVQSENGRGGGWRIACDLRNVSLLDIYTAVGGPKIFAIGHDTENPMCAVERVVNAALDSALASAEATLLKRLGTVSLAALAEAFNAICEREGWSAKSRKES